MPHVDFATFAFDVEPAPGGNAFLPFGWKGVFAALPFATWFYLAIEQLPLAAEEAHAPPQDLPRGILLGLDTLVVCALLTLTLSAGIAPGAAALGASDEPLLEGLKTIFGAGIGAKLLALLAVAGLVASFHTIIFAYGRQIFSVARSGYFPTWLSITHGTRQTPHVALVVGAALGYGVAFAIHLLGSDHPVGAVLLNMAVFGPVISVHVADPVTRAAAPAHAAHRASVPQPVGDPGRGGGVRYLGRNSRRTLRGGPELPERRDRCGVVVRGGLAVVRKRGPAPARLLARRALRGGAVESGAALH